ncbi:MAG: hypothetical protein K6G34_06160 [Lachnospiraceae bacterium]|nr:hypothetical protein [Lachnospiraceae bacterium]
MTVKQIYGELKQHDPEWIRQFRELLRLYAEAAPEHREKALELLRERKG